METALLYLAQPTMLIVIGIVFVTGIVRGFSGFGTGMMIGPSASAFFGPQMALVLIAILDIVPTVTLVWPARRHVNWKELLPIILGFAALMPLGVYVLKTGDALALRWFISISILTAVVILWSGWKYQGSRTNKISFLFGSIGGFMGAAAALPAPPVLIYWLAGSAKAITVRANMIFYLLLVDILVIAGYAFAEIFTMEGVVRGLLCIPSYFIGILIGAKCFTGASDTTYRRVAFTLILISALTSIPLLDGILRG